MTPLMKRLFNGTTAAQEVDWLRAGSATILIVVLAALPYMAGPYIVNVGAQILIFGLWAMSINILAGSTGLVSLGHAGFLGVAAYGVAVGQGRMGWSFWAAALVALIVTQAVAFALSLMTIRASGVYFLMITLAQGMLIWGVAQRWSSVTDGDNGLRTASRPAGLTEYWAYYWFTLVVVLLCVLALRLLLTSRLGLRLRGTKDSPTRMASLGYSVSRQRLIAFNLAGGFAGIAGVLHAGFFGFISPATVFLRQSVEGVLMIILGGVGAFMGPLLGSAGVIGARTALSVYTDRWPTFMGLLLIIVVLFAPAGIGGYAKRLRRSLRARRHPPVAAPSTPSALDELDTEGSPPGIPADSKPLP
jgi:branched-chain amino acid transport system permease protein